MGRGSSPPGATRVCCGRSGTAAPRTGRASPDSHTTLYVYQAGDPAADGAAPVADLISRPPAWTVQLGGGQAGGGATNVEGVAFGWDSHDLNLLAENRDVFFAPAAAYER